MIPAEETDHSQDAQLYQDIPILRIVARALQRTKTERLWPLKDQSFRDSAVGFADFGWVDTQIVSAMAHIVQPYGEGDKDSLVSGDAIPAYNELLTLVSRSQYAISQRP